jgi:very-short-patch-repair endonuclease
MVYRAVRQRLTTPGELDDLAARLRSVRGRKALTSTIAATASGSESYLETLALRSVFRGKAFADFIRQHRIRADGANYRLDMYHPVTRTAVELDGRAAHAETTQRTRDARRDARLASIGVLTLRFGYRDLAERPAWCREMVVRTMRGRCPCRVGLSAD